MSFLGKAAGIFSVKDSNVNIGSLFTIEDTLDILQINQKDVPDIITRLNNLMLLTKDGYVDETKLYKCYKCLKNTFSNEPCIHRVSLDEYVLKCIVQHEFPGIVIEQQVKVLKNNSVDFLLTWNNQQVYVEFDGPQQFISKQALKNPYIRSKQIEDETGIEVVHWPYWIQRCAQNLHVIFDRSQQGYGALWNSKAMFGDFTIANAGVIIHKMNERFNVERENSIGYFYEENKYGRKQPEQPIIKEIQKGKKPIDTLIPPGSSDIDYWLPQILRQRD